jgi:membrane-associated phospholipid phosphatase
MKETTLESTSSAVGPPEVRGIRARILPNLLFSFAAFIAAFVLAVNPDWFDRPLTRMIDSVVGRSNVFDNLVFSAYFVPTFSGVILLSLIWFSWFDSTDAEHRARILVGTLASLAIGGASRLLQHVLPTHPRPYYDPALHFQLPPGFSQVPLNTWNSFPSDHVVVFSGLAIVLYIARSKFALAAIVLTAVVELSRIYYGAHYPSDLLGGAALASIAVWAVQAPFFVSLGQLGARWERTRPAYFYMAAFFVSYQVATLAGDIRWVASVLRAASGLARDF